MVSSPTRIPSVPCTNPHPAVWLHRITSGQLFEITPDSQGALLLVKGFYVDFAGPGAAVGGEFDHTCTAVYVLGSVQLRPLQPQHDRGDAIQIRLTYAEQLAAIAALPNAKHRAQQIVHQLTDWLPGNLSFLVSEDLAAGLVGVLPTTIRWAWQANQSAQPSTKAIAGDRVAMTITPNRGLSPVGAR